MKKVFITVSVILLAAGCSQTPASINSSTSETRPTSQTPSLAPASETPNTPSPTPTTPNPSPVPATAVKTFTMDDIRKANNRDNCLTVIDGNVYNLTKWIDEHPGGDRNILRICGIDGTKAFESKHGGQKRPEEILKGFKIGVVMIKN